MNWFVLSLGVVQIVLGVALAALPGPFSRLFMWVDDQRVRLWGAGYRYDVGPTTARIIFSGSLILVGLVFCLTA
jgi:hypothetical protein